MGVDAPRRILPIGRRKGGIGSVIGASGEDGERMGRGGDGKDGDGENTWMIIHRPNFRTYM